MSRAQVLVLAAGIGLLHAVAARADDEIVKGSVVKVEHHEIYVSLGTKQGVADGSTIRLKRTIKLKHPLTRAPFEDWVPVGSATVTQAGAAMSRAVIGELIDVIKVGDTVESLIDRPDRPTPVAPPTATPPEPRPAAPPQDREAIEILNIFTAQSGATLDARIAGWERYLSTHAESAYTEGIRRDLDTLRGLRDQQRPVAAGASLEDVGAVRHNARARAYAGSAQPLVFVLDNPERVASAYLHYRPRDARTYRRLLLVREHDIYLRGTVPGEAITTPGFDYFVEVSTPAGRSGLAVGAPTAPIQIEVPRPPLIDQFGAAPGKSSVKLAVDYLDFATFDQRAGSHTDRMITGNVDFTYRLASVVQSVGVGYGMYSGSGGFADQVWDAGNPFPRSGFHYGYADLELGGTAERIPLSFGGKLIAGVGREGFGLGVEGRFRIGGRDATNLLVAARTVEQVGTLTDIRFGARPARDLLVGVSVGATNQPNQGDIGVKLGTELEWIGFQNVSVILRGSWQGRSVDHGGLGAGGGVGVYW